MAAKPEKVLTAKIAQKAVKDGDYDLSKYTDADDSAADFLADYEGCIKLDGIPRLSEHLARSLGKHKGGLSLGGISSLPEKTSAILSKRQGSIELNGLKKLSDESARHLTECPKPLSLDGLEIISDQLLKILASHKGALSLGAFTSISKDNAHLFSDHHGLLTLGDFKTLEPAVARILAKHPGNLELGIEDLSDEILDIFSERDEGVYIENLYDIEEVAKAQYNDDRDFIVSLDFYYCDVSYEGYRIMKKREVRNLVAALGTDAKIGTPNMPGDWYEEFDIALLKDSFAIHEPWPSYVQAMRKVFSGGGVGETSLFDRVLEHAPADDD